MLKIYETIKKLNGGSIPSDQWMVLSRVQHLGTHIDPMRVYSPSEIGYIFLKGLEKDNEMKVLSITEVEARMIYSSISGEFKKKLEDIRKQEELKEIELRKSKEIEINKILENKNSQEYLDLRKDVLNSLKQGYLEKGFYKKIPENDIPIEIIDKYVRMSILSQI